MSEQRKQAARAAAPSYWDMTAATFRDELAGLLRNTVADEGAPIDTGGGDGEADMWVTCGGVEFFVTIRRSNKQKLIDRGERQPNVLGGPLQP